MAAGNLVQGAVFTVMVVRAAMLRDPGFEAETWRAGRAQPAVFSTTRRSCSICAASRSSPTPASSPTPRRCCAPHLDPGRRAECRAGPARCRGRRRSGGLRANATQPSGRRPRRPRRAPAAPPAPGAPPKARLVTQPVRSGTQIYARGSRSRRHRAGQPRRRNHRRRQHPCLRRRCAAGRSPAPAATARREFSAAGSRRSWSASPDVISSASKSRRSTRVHRCRSRSSMIS